MAFDLDAFLAHEPPLAEQDLTPQDCLLYALSLGIGGNPTDPAELQFVYEKDLVAHPLMANVLGYPGFWYKDPANTVTWQKLLHGEQRTQIHRPLPTEGKLIGRTRVTAVDDKGPDRGSFIYSERLVSLAESGEPVCTIEQTAVCRADGGQGSFGTPSPRLPGLPVRAPDRSVTLQTLPQAALLYRLNGDMNPLHVDPDVARGAGFERPILHGLCTLGVAGHALVMATCADDPSRLASLSGRFSAPVYPGETLVTELWEEDDRIAYRTTVPERDTVVLTNGSMTLRD